VAMTGSGPIDAPGLAEIKPESPQSIRAGLYQLREYLWMSEYARGRTPSKGAEKRADQAKRATWLAGKKPDRTSIWLVTYLPWPDRAAPQHVRVFAYEVRREQLPEIGPLPSTTTVLKSRRELTPVKLDKYLPFPTPDKQPDMFGLAVEPLVRTEFRKNYDRVSAKIQDLGRQGPDVLWLELADLFRELADETGDGYWGELADELAAGF
jgi:hypothetical protein